MTQPQSKCNVWTDQTNRAVFWMQMESAKEYNFHAEWIDHGENELHQTICINLFDEWSCLFSFVFFSNVYIENVLCFDCVVTRLEYH